MKSLTRMSRRARETKLNALQVGANKPREKPNHTWDTSSGNFDAARTRRSESRDQRLEPEPEERNTSASEFAGRPYNCGLMDLTSAFQLST